MECNYLSMHMCRHVSWSDSIISWDPFPKWITSSYLKSCEKSFCCYFYSNDPVRAQFCTYHNSWAVAVCAKLWPDFKFNFHITATYIFPKFGLWVYKCCGLWNGPQSPLCLPTMDGNSLWKSLKDLLFTGIAVICAKFCNELYWIRMRHYGWTKFLQVW